MSDASSRRLIVSLTSYPARISFVPKVVESLLAQSRPADDVVLYLSGDQFPGRETDLPEALRDIASAGRLRLRWVDGDLKPHKKYIYAFREYPEDIVVTVDDDVVYDRFLLKRLWETHLKYPEAVVASRTHLIVLDPDGQPLPCSSWLIRTHGFKEGPSMQLFAIGIGGILYDPKLFPPELYNEQAIRETCLLTDDLWLKFMELAAGIPVVRCPGLEMVRTIPGSQEVSLCSVNVGERRNDEAFSAIRRWADGYYGRNVVRESLADGRWPRIAGERELLDFCNRDRLRMLDSVKHSVLSLESRLAETRQKNDLLAEQLRLIRDSRSYKLANKLLFPLRLFRKK